MFGSKHGERQEAGAVHDDLVERVLPPIAEPAVVDRHHRTRTSEGKLYLCAVEDVHSNRIVGYAISNRMKARLAVAAVESAVARRTAADFDITGCIVHSDRGSQFRSRKLWAELHRHDLIGSMGQVGSAGDNAAMGNFFGLLQNNVLDRQRWTSRQQLRLAIITWIERTSYHRRRQAQLGRLTPIEHETIMITNQTALAA